MMKTVLRLLVEETLSACNHYRPATHSALGAELHRVERRMAVRVGNERVDGSTAARIGGATAGPRRRTRRTPFLDDTTVIEHHQHISSTFRYKEPVRLEYWLQRADQSLGTHHQANQG